MVTVAHGPTYSFSDSDTPIDSPWFESVALSHSVTNGHQDIDGDDDFVVDDHGIHPVVYIEAEGHGVYGTPSAGYGVDDYVPVYLPQPAHGLE